MVQSGVPSHHLQSLYCHGSVICGDGTRYKGMKVHERPCCLYPHMLTHCYRMLSTQSYCIWVGDSSLLVKYHIFLLFYYFSVAILSLLASAGVHISSLFSDCLLH
jgi:hypothetical protein